MARLLSIWYSWVSQLIDVAVPVWWVNRFRGKDEKEPIFVRQFKRNLENDMKLK